MSNSILFGDLYMQKSMKEWLSKKVDERMVKNRQLKKEKGKSGVRSDGLAFRVKKKKKKWLQVMN